MDKLVKVYLNNGEESWNLIHTYIQNVPEKEFTERMLIVRAGHPWKYSGTVLDKECQTKNLAGFDG